MRGESWSRRLLDAFSCGTLAFFAQPLLSIVDSGAFDVSLPASAPEVLAIYIGYVGTDYIRARIQSWTQRKMGNNMNISSNGRSQIKAFEGLKLSAYPCSSNQWSILLWSYLRGPGRGRHHP